MNTQAPPHRPIRSSLGRAARWLFCRHLLGSLFIVLLATAVISSQVEDRADFANSELSKDVEDRWGAPVFQPAPSLRYVELARKLGEPPE